MSGDNITKIKKISITKFRALENIDIEFADRITVICGKNGMANPQYLVSPHSALASLKIILKILQHL